MKEPSEAETELNRFLGSNRLITAHREFVAQGENSYWAIAAEYISDGTSKTASSVSAKKKIDYKEVLSPEDFSIYARIRDWRKERANQEGVQLYTIFTNEQIAKMVENRITTKNGLKEIDGVGDARVEKYGNDVLSILKEETAKLNETQKQPVQPDTNP